MIIFEKNYNKNFLKYVRRAIDDYNMISPKDKIAVAVSGGKDSIFLLFCLKLIQLTAIKDIEIVAIHVDLGLDINLEPLKNFCKKNKIDLIIEKTNIANVVFNERNEKNPCSLCSKLRKGCLVRVAKSIGATKIALGHNCDDVIETLLMNVLKIGKFGSFNPHIDYKDKYVHIIRPLIYLREDLIKNLVVKYNLPVIKSTCPEDKKTTREEMKNLMFKLEETYPKAIDRLMTSLCNIDMKNIWKQRDNHF
ncbi:tRNA lysidine(34) synthetase [Clostridium sporogenes]|uniref:tRNA lysidine(34) synthetase n=1 Tax=Clostridium sporogenes TaxID=1509 RepID=UPI0028FE4363|nr:tRNA 2-thiocytidine biosynthesis TtcA family protein [Clostridium botulinum]